jgi:hypothetical protein
MTSTAANAAAAASDSNSTDLAELQCTLNNDQDNKQ